MSRTTRFRMMSQSLHYLLTRPQTIMCVDVDRLRAAAAQIFAGTTLTNARTSAIRAAQRVLGCREALTISSHLTSAERKQLAASVTTLADSAAVEQRTQITAAVTTALESQGWTVTAIEGGAPDRYTGIEATRGTEHLVAAAAAGALIADQAGAHDCGATVDSLTAALSQIGLVTIEQDVPHGEAGGTLYALEGGPTRAHAVQSSLRRDTPEARAGGRRRHRATATVPLALGMQQGSVS